MRLGFAGILFIIFAVLQFLFARKFAHQMIRFIPMLIPFIGGITVFAIIFISQNTYAILLFVPIMTSFVGSIIGLVISFITSKLK